MNPNCCVYGQLLKQQKDPSGRFTRSRVICHNGFIPVHSIIFRAFCSETELGRQKRCRTNGFDFTIRLPEYSVCDAAKAMLLLYTGKAKSNGVWFSVSEMAAISPAVKEVLKILGLEVMQKALGNQAANESTKVDVLISTDVHMLKFFLEVGGKSYEVLMDSDGRMKRAGDESGHLYTSLEAMETAMRNLDLEGGDKSLFQASGACD